MDRLKRVDDETWGWYGPVSVALLALVLRLWNLGYPRAVVFDETYYAKDAWSLLHYGFVREFTQDANSKIIDGIFTGIMTNQPTWIVHPDGGKWLIAIGEAIFGLTPYGWRFSAAIAGSLTVLVLARLVLRLTRNPWIATFAGLLMALDGLAFTLSRIALLDIFVGMWLTFAVACLVADHDWIEAKLQTRPFRWYRWRPWQLAAGFCFGMATASKWNGLIVLAAFGVAVVVWEFTLRSRTERAHGLAAPNPVVKLLQIGVPAFGLLVVVALGTYLLTWTGWLWHHSVYEHRFGHGYGDIKPWPSVAHPWHGPFAFWNPLRSLWAFHVMTYDFHTGSYLAKQTHPYQSHPAGWLIQWRPVNVWDQTNIPAAKCGAPAGSSCMREVLLLGNPAVWWGGVVAYVSIGLAVVAALLRRRTAWRLSIPLIGLASTWLPWFTAGTRPIFNFYAIAILPFTIIAIALVVNGAWRRATTPRRVTIFWLATGAYVGLVVALFCYFHPIWTGSLITYDQWNHRTFRWSKHWV